MINDIGGMPMGPIDEKFKDTSPEQTVERIQAILGELGIVLEENWHDSGIENCWSVSVFLKDGFPLFANGKGVTRALARASAYAEFIERMQCGLFLYKFQSITRDFSMNLHSYAPDGKYMTMAQLEENGDWMDYVIQTYGKGLTRKKLAKQCKVYACTDEDKIWTLPFYSLFEDKYVYLPAGFVEHVYSANGCCAGNTREEAWVHALSEMMERRSAVSQLMSGKALPPIPEETLRKFPTAAKILDKIHQSGKYDIQIFDLSLGNGFPVVATRIINKKTHGYVVNIAADPVMEIAIDRTLTEIFQGRNIETFSSIHNGSVLSDISQIPPAHNVLNQVENGNGLFTVDFFTEEVSCDRTCTRFEDHRNKNNKELLDYMIGLYKDLNRPVYVRNYSFLGFSCYQFVVPGFSETRGLRLVEPIAEYALGDEAVAALRDPAAATDDELAFLMMYHKKVQTAITRRHNFAGLAGLPLDGPCTKMLMYATLAYAAWRLKRYPAAVKYLDTMAKFTQIDGQTRAYFSCVNQYIKLKAGQVPEEKIRIVLGKFYESEYVDALYERLDGGKSPFDGYLLCCDCKSCHRCRYQSDCSYTRVKEILADAGKRYSAFTGGQSKDHFTVIPQL